MTMPSFKQLSTMLAIAICLYACSKDKGPSPDPGKQGYGLNGTLIYNWATEGILKTALKTGVRSTVLPENTGRYGWDVSRDGTKILQSTEAPDDLDANLYTYSDIASGTVVSQFKYYPENGDLTNGFISPDQSMIAIDPTFDDGIIIVNMKGKVLYNLTGYGGKKFGYGTQIAWMPDNSLLFTLGQSIYRTNTDFTKATLIKTLSFESWGDLAVSFDGQKIAFDGGNHIWTMMSDGSQLTQVTTSDSQEKVSAFSPDGQYLLIGTDYQVTGPFGSMWYLAIIPADGKQYNVNKGADTHVIPIQDPDQGGQACDGFMYWR